MPVINYSTVIPINGFREIGRVRVQYATYVGQKWPVWVNGDLIIDLGMPEAVTDTSETAYIFWTASTVIPSKRPPIGVALGAAGTV